MLFTTRTNSSLFSLQKTNKNWQFYTKIFEKTKKYINTLKSTSTASWYDPDKAYSCSNLDSMKTLWWQISPECDQFLEYTKNLPIFVAIHPKMRPHILSLRTQKFQRYTPIQLS